MYGLRDGELRDGDAGDVRVRRREHVFGRRLEERDISDVYRWDVRWDEVGGDVYVWDGWFGVLDSDVWDVRVPDADGWSCVDDVVVVCAFNNHSWGVFYSV